MLVESFSITLLVTRAASFMFKLMFFACFFETEKYFDMNKKNCKEGLDIYKKLITRMDRVSDFLKVAEDVGFDKDDIPDLSKVMRPQLLFICMPCLLNLMIKRGKCGSGESYL